MKNTYRENESKIKNENQIQKVDSGFGETCSALRNKMGVSMEDFGSVFGMSSAEVKRIELGAEPKNQYNVRKIYHIAKRMGVI